MRAPLKTSMCGWLVILLMGIQAGLGGVPARAQDEDDGQGLTPEEIASLADFEEGTETELPPEQLKDLQEWAEGSLQSLKDLVRQVQTAKNGPKKTRLLQGIRDVVSRSRPQDAELFLRYILNRGMKISEMLDHETKSPVTLIQLALLSETIALARRSGEPELAWMREVVATPGLPPRTKRNFKLFGVAYFNFMKDQIKTWEDATAQYQGWRKALGYLAVDLYRDQENAAWARDILRIHNVLKRAPKRVNDARARTWVRLFLQLSEQVEALKTS